MGSGKSPIGRIDLQSHQLDHGVPLKPGPEAIPCLKNVYIFKSIPMSESDSMTHESTGKERTWNWNQGEGGRATSLEVRKRWPGF